MYAPTIQHAYCRATPMQASEGLPCLRLQIIPEDKTSYVRAWKEEDLAARSWWDWFWNPSVQIGIPKAKHQREIVHLDIQGCKERLAHFGIDPKKIDDAIRLRRLDDLICYARETYRKSQGYIDEFVVFSDFSNEAKETYDLDWDFCGLESSLARNLFSSTFDIEEFALHIYQLVKGVFSFSKQEAKQVAIYWFQNQEELLARAKQETRTITLLASITKLARTIMISPEGRLYILFNRKSIGDRLIGQGSTKRVTSAVEVMAGRIFASSSCFVSHNKEDRAFSMMHEEAKLMQKISHLQGVLPLVDLACYTKKGGGDAIRMFTPLSQGGDLDTFLKKKEPSFAGKSSICFHLLEALHNLHSAGIVHRDIKDRNILMMKEEKGHRPVLADFGFAQKKQDAENTRDFRGTLLHMSPEYLYDWAKNQNLGAPKVDYEAHEVWSLGIVFYRMWIGDPFSFSYTDPLSFAEGLLSCKSPERESFVADREEKPCWKNLIREMLFFDPEKRIKLPDAIDYAKKNLTLKVVIQEPFPTD